MWGGGGGGGGGAGLAKLRVKKPGDAGGREGEEVCHWDTLPAVQAG